MAQMKPVPSPSFPASVAPLKLLGWQKGSLELLREKRLLLENQVAEAFVPGNPWDVEQKLHYMCFWVRKA